MNATKFTVRTNYGWGWKVPQAPECPSFGSQYNATKYVDLRNGGTDHDRAYRIATNPFHEMAELEAKAKESP